MANKNGQMLLTLALVTNHGEDPILENVILMPEDFADLRLTESGVNRCRSAFHNAMDVAAAREIIKEGLAYEKSKAGSDG